MGETDKLLTTILGAVLGYSFGWLKSSFEDRRRRRAIATALVVELEHILINARKLWLTGNANWSPEYFLTPMHDRFINDVHYFRPDTVQAVFTFSEEMRRLRRCLETADRGQERNQHLQEHGEDVVFLGEHEHRLLIREGAMRVHGDKRVYPPSQTLAGAIQRELAK